MSKNKSEREGILVKVRLDFRGKGKRNFLFKSRNTEKAAEDTREHQLALFRNIPVQGAEIIDIDAGNEVYTVFDEITNAEVAYAPLILTIRADSLESLIKFIARDEFRKIEVLDPAEIVLNHNDVERVLYQIYEDIKEIRSLMERKYN
ncbi:MAG: hypothetical protein FWD21_00830 [Peptococcaceae bacterium]|nr:hypothetical protein [Peptococcaceae bacterium]